MTPKRRILKDFELQEVSSVDRPAQVVATMAIIKAFADKNATTFAEVLTAVTTGETAWPMSDTLKDLITSILKSNIIDADQSIDAFASRMHDLVDASTLTKIASILAGDPGQSPRGEENEMTQDELQKLYDESSTRIAALTTELAVAKAYATLSDDEKAFAATLDEAAQSHFIQADAAARGTQMAVSKQADETLQIAGGRVIRKSVVGEDVFEGMKAQAAETDALRKQAVEDRERLEIAGFTKQAGDEFSHLPGTPEAVAQVLRSIDKMVPEAKQAALTILKSAEEVAAKSFETAGRTSGSTHEDSSAVAQIETLTKQYRESHPAVTEEQAYAAVLQQNPGLYDQVTS